MASRPKSQLAEMLAVLTPNLQGPMAETTVLNALERLAAGLPAIPRGGFECRLAADNPAVDLQLCVEPTAGDIPLVTDWLAGLSPDHPAQSPLLGLLALWSGDRRPQQRIPEVWLEFDCDGGDAQEPVPAIFFALPQDPKDALQDWHTAEKGLNTLFGPEAWRPWHANLRKCFECCPTGVFVSHIGAMLSRRTSGVRVNTKRLDSETLPAFLELIGWPGDRNAAAQWAKLLLAFADRLTLSLDVGEDVGSHLGLEAIFTGQPPAETAWAGLLDTLVRQGLCDPAKGEALLAWPGRTTPLDARAPWPESWIWESLPRPADQFSTIERRLSHIKVGLPATGDPEAKGYLWFAHRWLKAGL